MLDVGNLEGAQVESTAATQDSGSEVAVGSDCKRLDTKKRPPQALKVLRLKKSKEAKDVEQDEVATLRENLRAMVNNPKHSDVRFVCQDGGKVFGSRLFLVARSPMLQSLLSNGMAESRMDEIELPIVTTSAMLAAIEFLYTGCIVTQQLTWVSALEIIHASNYLLLDNLRDYVMTHLSEALDDRTIQCYTYIDAKMEGEFTAWCLTELAESVTSCGKQLLQHSASARLVRGLVSKIQNTDSYSINNLSLSAFNLYLDATKSVNGTSISFKEYLRLRSILLWACTRLSPVIEGCLRKCLRDEKWLRSCTWEALDGLDCLDTLAASFRGMTLPDSRLQLGPWIEKLERGWSSVSLDCIHPVLLSKVVEPLGVIPESLVVSAFRNQAVGAVREGNRNLMTWDEVDDEEVTILDSGTMVSYAPRVLNPTTTDIHSIFVYCSMLINHGLCEWDVTVRGFGSFVYIGLTETKPPKVSAGSNRGWLRWLGNSGCLYGGSKVGDKYCAPFNHTLVSIVRVHVNMAARTCAFTIDGEEYKTAWSDVPDEVYPCVAIGASRSPVDIRIKLASDPNFV